LSGGKKEKTEEGGSWVEPEIKEDHFYVDPRDIDVAVSFLSYEQYLSECVKKWENDVSDLPKELYFLFKTYCEQHLNASVELDAIDVEQFATYISDLQHYQIKNPTTVATVDGVQRYIVKKLRLLQLGRLHVVSERSFAAVAFKLGIVEPTQSANSGISKVTILRRGPQPNPAAVSLALITAVTVVTIVQIIAPIFQKK